MKKLFPFLILVIIGLGGYYAYQQSPTDSDASDTPGEAPDPVDGVVKDFGAWSYADSEQVWVMSTKLVSVTLPGSWKIQQGDAGGLSKVSIARPEAESATIAIDIFTPIEFTSGESIAFETWREEFVTGVKGKICTTVRLDAFNADCFETEDGSTYLLLKGSEHYFKVRYPTQISEDAQAIIDRLDFYPDPGSLVNAEIIP